MPDKGARIRLPHNVRDIPRHFSIVAERYRHMPAIERAVKTAADGFERHLVSASNGPAADKS